MNVEYRERKSSPAYRRLRASEELAESQRRAPPKRAPAHSIAPAPETEETRALRAELSTIAAEHERITTSMNSAIRAKITGGIKTVYAGEPSDRRKLLELESRAEDVKLRLQRLTIKRGP